MALDGMGTSPTLRVSPPPSVGGMAPPPVAAPSLGLGDCADVAHRPVDEAERQQALVQAVQQAQAQPPDPSNPSACPVPKTVADAIGTADGVREGVRIATSSDELAKLPLLGRIIERGGRLSAMTNALTGSKLGLWVAAALTTHPILAPAARFLGRIAPFAGLAVAGYDIWDATRTHDNPRASGIEKGLAITKAVFSGLASVAGVATLVLAPTGIGAAIAGGIALGAGLAGMAADLALAHFRKPRLAAERREAQLKKAAGQPAPLPAR